ncbi:MAG: bacterial Ig-like domain-containing protein [Clostridia bacterium]
MNKKISALLAIILILLAPILFSACKVGLYRLYVKQGTVPVACVVGDTLDFTDTVLVMEYLDGSVKEIAYPDLTLGEVSTETSGEKTLTITYKENTVNVTINVYNNIDEAYQFVGFGKPNFIVTYRSNIATKIDNKETEFLILDDGYFVGDDNAFKFLPEITVVLNSEISTLNKYKSISSVDILQDDVWTELTDTALTEMVTVDDEWSTFDFTESAIGKEFRITVRPYYLTLEELNEFSDGPISFSFKVIDGWNAYSAEDLSKIDNNTNNAWEDYKTDHNVSYEAINAIIMHNDIAITANDIPADFIYTPAEEEQDSEQVAGSLKDRRSIYSLITDSDTEFNFIGNYFTLNASQIPLIVKGNTMGVGGEGVISHSTLFGFAGDDYNIPANTPYICPVTVKNINIIGNASRTETLAASGGFTLFRTSSKSFTMNNTIVKAVCTILCPFGQWVDTDESVEVTNYEVINEVTLLNSKGYDSFSCMFYLWGADVTMENCEYKRAGGPLIINADYGNDEDRNYSTLTTSNTILENPVTGLENWFKLNGASNIATDLKAVLSGLNQIAGVYEANLSLVFDSTQLLTIIGDNGYINLIGVVMSDDLGDTYDVKGAISINIADSIIDKNTTALDKEGESYVARNQELATMLTALYDSSAYEAAVPIFQSSNGGIVFTDGTYFYIFNGTDFIKFASINAADHLAILSALTQTDIEAIQSFFAGDYMYVYANADNASCRMGVVIGFN